MKTINIGDEIAELPCPEREMGRTYTVIAINDEHCVGVWGRVEKKIPFERVCVMKRAKDKNILI